MGKRGKGPRSRGRRTGFETRVEPAQARVEQPRSRAGIVIACGIVAAAAILYFSFWPPAAAEQATRSAHPDRFVGGADTAYVDSSACAGCHTAIAETYVKTGMGRSFFRPVPEKMLGDFSASEAFYHAPSDRYYSMQQRDGRYFQRRYQLAHDGTETNVLEKEIHYVTGSGNHARSYLHQGADGKIVQLPLGWYAERRGFWAMSPGYDQPNHKGFQREISLDCMFCHNSYPETAAGEDLAGRDPRFKGTVPEGIDCQRCHGPGRAHLEAAGSGQPAQAVRQAILNPARLSAKRQMEVCMQCHLETTSNRLPHAIRRFERGAFSYRPGEPLADYVLHFDKTPEADSQDRFEIAHAAYRLRKSACFQASEGTSSAITCTTCHDPHDTSRQGEAERISEVCRDCHQQPIAALVSGKRHPDSDNCLTCHMPKRRTDDVVHVVMTDHYIQRHLPKVDLTAPKQETHEDPESEYKGEVVPYYPAGPPSTPEDQLYVAVAQIMEDSNLQAGIDRLEPLLAKFQPKEGEFYFHLAEAYWKTGQPKRAGELYAQALERSPGHAVALRNYGATLIETGAFARAAELLEQGCTAGEADAKCFSNLGEALTRQGRHRPAIEMLRRAVNLDPDLPEAHANLASAYSRNGDRVRAIASSKEAIRLRTDFHVAHTTLANLLAEQGQDAEAERHYKTALKHDPEYPEAHYNYGSWLIGRRRAREAERLLKRAVQLRPNFAEAHNNLGNLLAMKGRTAEGIQHFQAAIESDPRYIEAQRNLATTYASIGEIESAMQSFRDALKIDSNDPIANLNLGIMLANGSDPATARAHLQKAAGSSDPAIQAAAQQAISSLQSSP